MWIAAEEKREKEPIIWRLQRTANKQQRVIPFLLEGKAVSGIGIDIAEPTFGFSPVRCYKYYYYHSTSMTGVS